MRRRAAQGLPAKVPAPQPHVRDRTTLDPAKSHRRRRPRRVHDRVKGPLEAPHPGRTVILGRPLSPTCSGVGQAGCSDASMGSQRWQRFCTLPPSQVGIPDEDGGRGLTSRIPAYDTSSPEANSAGSRSGRVSATPYARRSSDRPTDVRAQTKPGIRRSAAARSSWRCGEEP